MIDSNLISSKLILAKIIADNDLREDDLRISDIREWIGEGLEKIGAVQLFEHKVENIPVKGFQAKLPCDLQHLGLVAFSFNEACGWLPMRKSTGSFGPMPSAAIDKPEMLIPDKGLIPLVKNLYPETDGRVTTDKDALDILNNDINIRKTLSALVNQYTIGTVNGKFIGYDNTNFSHYLQYMTKPGYIVTSVPEGVVKVSYEAIHSDEDGMPMIPDIASYKEALYWYTTMKLKYPEYMNGRMPQYIYHDIKRSWNFYRNQAYAEAMMPGVDDMETINNIWTKFAPEISDHSGFYSTSGDRQILYDKNS